MNESLTNTPRRGFTGKQVLLFMLATLLITVGVSFWLFRTYIHPADFKPVTLTIKEQRQLDTKLSALGLNPRELLPDVEREDARDADGRLIPEEYVENAEKRDIHMSERELNSMLASNPELARRFAIDLSDNLASAKLLIPIDPDFPIMAGKTLRVSTGIEIAYRQERPVVKLRGVSVMGVPIPNSWLGNLKNVDLVSEFGNDPGFWKSFSAGIELLEVVEGELHVKLKE